MRARAAAYGNGGGALRLYNTILANSGAGGDCFVNASNVILANVHNLVEDGSCSAAFSGDPALGPLADNGGDSFTHALLPGSLAMEAGDDTTCLTTDQRGVTRPQGNYCDIGTYEAPPQPILHLTKQVSPTIDVPYRGVVTYTLALRNTGALSDTHVILTDTLPTYVNFAGWVISPTNTSFANGAITWTDTLTPGAAITWTFRAAHTGSYGDMVINSAHFSGTRQAGRTLL